jgi:DNA polymerase III epsilon subunit-like protein
MSNIYKVSVDIEADGPAPHLYSMISLGACILPDHTNEANRFYMELAPISKEWIPQALAVSGFTREQTLKFPHASIEMQRFATWLEDHKQSPSDRFMFVSDNAGFDWQFVNYYFWKFTNGNPFGHSSLSLTSLVKGYARNMRASVRDLRTTKHTHNALDDATGNAEVMHRLAAKGLNIF